MLPFSREVYFSLFGELNTRFTSVQILAFLLVLYLSFQLLRRDRIGGRMPFLILSLLWIGCAYFWLYRIFAEINFLAPLYAMLAGAQAFILAFAAIRPPPTNAVGNMRAVNIALIALALIWPIIDLLTGYGWPLARIAGLPLVPLLLLTPALLDRLPARSAFGLGLIPFLLSLVCAYQAYVLGLHQDWLPLLAMLYTAAIIIRPKPGT